MRYILGPAAFANYILYIWFRWARVTTRRYGLRGLLSSSYRPRRAGVGHGSRANPLGRAHGHGTAVWSLLRDLERERRAAAPTQVLVA